MAFWMLPGWRSAEVRITLDWLEAQTEPCLVYLNNKSWAASWERSVSLSEEIMGHHTHIGREMKGFSAGWKIKGGSSNRFVSRASQSDKVTTCHKIFTALHLILGELFNVFSSVPGIETTHYQCIRGSIAMHGMHWIERASSQKKT